MTKFAVFLTVLSSAAAAVIPPNVNQGEYLYYCLFLGYGRQACGQIFLPVQCLFSDVLAIGLLILLES